jgi:hypothetical protein
MNISSRDITKLEYTVMSTERVCRVNSEYIVSALQPRCIPDILIILDHSLVFRVVIPDVVLTL